MKILLLLLISIVFIILFRIIRNKSNNEKILTDIRPIVDRINSYAYKGNGRLSRTGGNEFSLYETKSNQIVLFHYNTNSEWKITWKYKWYKNELTNTINIGLLEGKSNNDIDKITRRILVEMIIKIHHHKHKINKAMWSDNTDLLPSYLRDLSHEIKDGNLRTLEIKDIEPIVDYINENEFNGFNKLLLNAENNIESPKYIFENRAGHKIVFSVDNKRLFEWKYSTEKFGVLISKEINEISLFSKEEKELFAQTCIDEMNEKLKEHEVNTQKTTLKRQSDKEMENLNSIPNYKFILDTIEQNGIVGFAAEMQKLYSNSTIVTANGNELIINRVDFNAVENHKRLVYNLSHIHELSLIELEAMNIQKLMLEDFKQKIIKLTQNQPEIDKQLFRKANVQRITYQFGGITAFSFDFE